MRRMSWFVVVNCVLVFALGVLEFRQEDAVAMPLPNAVAQEANSEDQLSGVVPRLVRFSGTVTDATGKVVTGIISLSFSIYELKEGDTPLWGEIQEVQTDPQGRYTVLLGANSPDGLPLDLFTSGKALWLGVQPQLPGAAEQPRLLLVAVPYALKAADADTLGGKPASAFLTAESQTCTATGSGSSAGTSSGTGLAGRSNAGVGTTQPCVGGGCGTVTSVSGSNAIAVTSPTTTPARVLRPPLVYAQTSDSTNAAQIRQNGRTHVPGDTTMLNVISSPATTGPNNGTTPVRTSPTPKQTTISTDSISLPATTGPSVGVINLGGVPFLHAYANPTSFGQNTFVGSYAGNFSMGLGGGWSGSGNTGLGYTALTHNTTGSNNTAVGDLALYSNTSGSYNTALGLALQANTTGNANTAIGYEALVSNTTAGSNTAVGSGALEFNTTGSESTAVGVDALTTNTTGIDNTAVGAYALAANTTGKVNTAVGINALVVNTTGTNNTAIGANTLTASITGIANTALGEGALMLSQTGSWNTAIGENANQSNTSGSNNTAVGQGTLDLNTTGSDNVAVGYQAMTSNLSGGKNVAVGENALYYNTVSNETAVGYGALILNSTGAGNTAVGYYTLATNRTGAYNVALGWKALNSSNANSNTAVGYQSLVDDTSGASNTAVGLDALQSNVSGASNAALGALALQVSTASNLTAVGDRALGSNTSGANNTAVGYQAGVTGTSGSANTTGAENTYIGYNAGPGSATQYSYQTDLGAGAVGTCSSCIVLGRTTDKVAIGATAPSSALTVNGAISNGVTTATNNDNRGKITLVAGTGAYTFTQGPGSGGVWTTAPICVVSSTAASPVEAQVTTTPSTLTITVPGGSNTDTYNYICWPGN